MSEELKLCPFCGGTGGNVNDSTKHKPTCYFVKEQSMGIMYGLVKEWNIRPIEDELCKQLEECKRLMGEQGMETIHQSTKNCELQRQLDIAVEALKIVKVEVFDGIEGNFYLAWNTVDDALAEIEKCKS